MAHFGRTSTGVNRGGPQSRTAHKGVGRNRWSGGRNSSGSMQGGHVPGGRAWGWHARNTPGAPKPGSSDWRAKRDQWRAGKTAGAQAATGPATTAATPTAAPASTGATPTTGTTQGTEAVGGHQGPPQGLLPGQMYQLPDGTPAPAPAPSTPAAGSPSGGTPPSQGNAAGGAAAPGVTQLPFDIQALIQQVLASANQRVQEATQGIPGQVDSAFAGIDAGRIQQMVEQARSQAMQQAQTNVSGALSQLQTSLAGLGSSWGGWTRTR